jgi:hypothetical protein
MYAIVWLKLYPTQYLKKSVVSGTDVARVPTEGSQKNGSNLVLKSMHDIR